jgi:septum formation protein
VITGLCLLDIQKNRTLIGCERTKVMMKRLEPYQIEEYVLSGEGLGKAGGVSIQERGASFIKGIEGCFYNVVGLPLSRLEDMLSELGYRI